MPSKAERFEASTRPRSDSEGPFLAAIRRAHRDSMVSDREFRAYVRMVFVGGDRSLPEWRKVAECDLRTLRNLEDAGLLRRSLGGETPRVALWSVIL